MRNPNGYGSVVKLSGNRRNPFAVRKTIGWNEKGYPVYLIIGYVASREDGMILLADYNKSPWDVDAEKITLTELFELWLEKKGHKLGKSSQASLKSAFKHTHALQEMPYKSLKSYHMQDVIDNCGRSASTQGAIQNLFGHLDSFALEIDVINKGYSQLLKSAAQPDTKKKPFTDEEVAVLWENQDVPWVDTVLMYMYTGFRISELLDMKIENVDLEQGTFRGGTKTKAGKNRIVPIHSKIRDFVVARYEEGQTYLIRKEDGSPLSSHDYYKEWKKLMAMFQFSHTPHECRNTFRSWLDSAGANKVCIDMILGHKSRDVGEQTYTHKGVEELRTAIELVTS